MSMDQIKTRILNMLHGQVDSNIYSMVESELSDLVRESYEPTYK